MQDARRYYVFYPLAIVGPRVSPGMYRVELASEAGHEGSQYTSVAFSKRCESADVRPSMGSAGDCYDNAMCESFNAILECELLVKRRFKTQREAALKVFEFIEGFYNPRRRHTSIGNISPMEFERRMNQAA